MKPATFGYHHVESIADAVEVLGAYDGTARILSGGQSLIPMMNMRLLRPDALVDVNDVDELSTVEMAGEEVSVGSVVRYRDLESHHALGRRLPLLPMVLRHIGDRQVRNRGTIGGSLAHGDPTGELPLACLVLGASVEVAGPSGTRRIAVSDLYLDSYATAIDPLEVLTRVFFPSTSVGSASFIECCRRHNDFAVVSVACTGIRDERGAWTHVRVGVGAVAPTPVLAAGVGRALTGSTLSDPDIEEAARLVSEAIDPPTDVRASAEYRRHLAPIFVARALRALREQRAA